MENHISVIGKATYSLKPETYEANIEIRLKTGVKYNGRPATERQASRRAAVEKLLSIFVEKGIEDRQIQYNGTRDREEWWRKKGTQVVRTTALSIEHSDIRVIASIAGWIEGETFKDVEVRLGALNAEYKDSVDLEARAFSSAFSNAKQIASTIADEAGVKLGKPVKIVDERIQGRVSQEYYSGAVVGAGGMGGVEEFDFKEQSRDMSVSLVVHFEIGE